MIVVVKGATSVAIEMRKKEAIQEKDHHTTMILVELVPCCVSTVSDNGYTEYRQLTAATVTGQSGRFGSVRGFSAAPCEVLLTSCIIKFLLSSATVRYIRFAVSQYSNHTKQINGRQCYSLQCGQYLSRKRTETNLHDCILFDVEPIDTHKISIRCCCR